MIRQIKDGLFFPVASYFAFFAKKSLKKWNPKIIVVTGSSGKTTLFSFLESQLKDVAHFSHHANSALGVPFDILNLHRKTLLPHEWIMLFIKAPLNMYKSPYSENLYVVECDADRPGEAEFLAKLLKPEVTLWVSTSRTHSMNFDKLVSVEGHNKNFSKTRKTFSNVETAIAHEFGYFLEHTKKLVVINKDSDLMQKQKSRTKAEVKEVSIKDLTSYSLDRNGTEFEIENKKHVRIHYLLPKEIFYAIEMTKILCDYLTIKIDYSFKNLRLPPARSSIFRGIKDITIIDSTYNANLSSMTAILHMFKTFPAKKKWAVIGDMLEQGVNEQEEHQKLAKLLIDLSVDRIIFLGPRVKKFTYPILQEEIGEKIPMTAYENPKDVLKYLQEHIRGHETILFKGARFLEGVIENLLLDKKEKKLLARREKVWEKRRKKWGL